jgi:CDP-diacylglycerol--glycerol-3-phosphate 3-phosphatidyltransferase
LERTLNLPNTLTLIRVLLIPVFIFFLSFHTPPPQSWALAAAGIFLIASITDWLDGYIARRTGQITKFGKLFDPIADKLLTSSALILLVALNELPAWIAIVIIGREYAVTGLRAAASSEGYVIPAFDGGKAKMFFQIVAIIALLIDIGYKSAWLDSYLIGTVAIWIAMILAVVSGAQYFLNFWDKIGLRGGS